MSNISEVVDVQISADTVTPTQKGFGTPLVLAYHTHYTDRIRTYADLDSMVSDGFSLDSAPCVMAAKHFSQSPRVEQIKVGRASTAVQHTVKLTMTTSTEGDVVSLTIDDEAGNSTDISYTVLAAATTTTVATAVELLVEAVTGIDSTSALAVITAVGTTSGKVFWYRNLVNCTIQDTTPNASMDDDLTAIEIVDDDWYEVSSSLNSKTNVDDIAAWTETRDKIFVAQTQDQLELTGSAAMGPALKALAYKNTALIFTRDAKGQSGAAWAGRMLPYTPGSATWALKSVTGIAADSLTATERGYLEAQNSNYYSTVAGVSITRKGTMAGGQFIDITVGTHWIKARAAEEIFSLMASLPKVPYTDKGIRLVTARLKSVLLKAAQNGIITAESISITVDAVADISIVDKALRLLPDIKFSATLQGAIHKAVLRGSLTV